MPAQSNSTYQWIRMIAGASERSRPSFTMSKSPHASPATPISKIVWLVPITRCSLCAWHSIAQQDSSGMIFTCPTAGDAIDGDHRQNDRAGMTYEYDIIAANQIPNKFAAMA